MLRFLRLHSKKDAFRVYLKADVDWTNNFGETLATNLKHPISTKNGLKIFSTSEIKFSATRSYLICSSPRP